jgi:hypothetical protein
MSVELDKLTAEVTRIKTVVPSAVALIQGLAAQILDLKDDPAALEALAADLNSQATSLADAVAANTPAPPTP